MKKLYLFLASLVVFVLFPQLSFADMVVAQNDGLDYNSVNKSSLSCLSKKKQKLKTYKGPNLQLKRGKLFREQVLSGYSYFLSSESQTPTVEESLLGDCKDYLIIGSIGEGENKIALYYDVTEVMPSSFLKYVSDTQELQVFPPRSEEAEEKKIEDEEEEEVEEILEGTTVDVSDTLKAVRETTAEAVVQNDTSKQVTGKSEIRNDEELTEEPADEEETQEKEKVKRPKKNIILMLSFAFFFTAFIEGIVTLLFFGLDWKMVGVVVVANLLTNPVLNLLIFHYDITSTIAVLGLELVAVLIEAGILVLYMRKNYIKLGIFVVVANAASYFVGAYLVNMQFWLNAINKI